MKVHFTTLGCPKNQVDSELMLGMLTREGHEITDVAETADCLVVNTCAFIDRAREESVQTILEMAKVKEAGRARALIVTGCLTQRYGGEILSEIPEVTAILGTSDLDRIAAPHRARAVCLREDRRRLRHGLHVLCDPTVPRGAPEPPSSRHRGRGGRAGAPRNPGSDPRLSRHARLRPRPDRQRRHRRSAPGAL